jgi:hypothetical protein
VGERGVSSSKLEGAGERGVSSGRAFTAATLAACPASAAQPAPAAFQRQSLRRARAQSARRVVRRRRVRFVRGVRFVRREGRGRDLRPICTERKVRGAPGVHAAGEDAAVGEMRDARHLKGAGTCPVSTGGGTRLVRLVRGRGGGRMRRRAVSRRGRCIFNSWSPPSPTFPPTARPTVCPFFLRPAHLCDSEEGRRGGRGLSEEGRRWDVSS